MNQEKKPPCAVEFQLTITSSMVTEPAAGNMITALLQGSISAHALGHAFAAVTLNFFNEHVEAGLIRAKLNDTSSPEWFALQMAISAGMQCALRNAVKHGTEGGIIN